MKKYYILTFGCQMNVYDSNLMAFLLENEGYKKAKSVEDADAIIVNTCAVREHAVDRVMVRLNQLNVLKKRKPNIRIGVTGCIPQQIKGKLFKEKPFVDFLLGPDNLKSIISCIKNGKGVFTDFTNILSYSDLLPAMGRFPEAFVSVMRGCNNFCSYCIVPYTRGAVKSRRIEDVKNEVKKLSKKGYKRVVLIGQNVNDYKSKYNGLPYLLRVIANIKGIERIGFLTSHPAYFPLEVIDVMKDEPKIERFLHLPLQSGSSRILKMMQRGYTKDEYIKIVTKIRDRIGDISLSTDVIVGFPNETEKDFKETLETVKIIGFDFAYMFKYSPRKYTLANTFVDNVNEEIKAERLKELIRVQSEITRQKSETYKGKILDVLITGRNKKNYLESNGIMVYNKRMVVRGRFNTGDMIKVRIEVVKGWTPIGIPIFKPIKIPVNNQK